MITRYCYLHALEFPGYGCETAIIASLKDKKWRGIHCPYDILSLCVPDWITMHGRLHSRVRVKIINGIQCCGPYNSLIYFDVVSEKFHMFPIPDTVSEKIDQFQIPKLENAIVGLGVLNGCLSMTYLDYCKDLEIWIMKEYGVKESWTSLFIIRNLEICHYYGLAKPLFMTKTGKIVLLLWSNGAKVVAYNPKYDSIRDFLVPSERESINAITYVESLISPKEYYWNNYIHK
ncbi:F-box/kelch-repeat protein At3g06240-like [Nicotiana tomentosiformis]|uniref:F-box/kelch-repeat protein At3g06240-like n=1 Tax=Nicotiana tomentosiformis TaxID=4098 RepID=UPI00388C766F